MWKLIPNPRQHLLKSFSFARPIALLKQCSQTLQKNFPGNLRLLIFFLYSPFLLSLVFLLFPERNLKFLLHTHFQFYLLCPLIWFCIINTSKGVGKEWRLMAQNRIFLKVSFKNSCHIYDSYPHITWYKSKHANNYKFSFLLYYWFVNFGYPSLS